MNNFKFRIFGFFVVVLVILLINNVKAVKDENCLFDFNKEDDFKITEHHFISNDFNGNSRLRTSVIFEKRESIQSISQKAKQCEYGVILNHHGKEYPLDFRAYDQYGELELILNYTNKNSTRWVIKFPSKNLINVFHPFSYSIEFENNLIPKGNALEKIDKDTYIYRMWGGSNFFNNTETFQRTISLPDSFFYSSRIISMKPVPTQIYNVGELVNLFYCQEEIVSGRNAIFIKFQRVPIYINWLLLFLAIIAVILAVIPLIKKRKKTIILAVVPLIKKRKVKTKNKKKIK